MLGAIAGDIIGSVYEWDNIKTKDFPLFKDKSTATDDTILTVATADHFISGKSYTEVYQGYGRAHQGYGYGGNFSQWIFKEDPQPYDSWGNGSAMRVSPVGYALNTLEETLAEARRSAEVTHNHPEGIKGAQAVAGAIWMAKEGEDKDSIKEFIENSFSYDLNRTLDSIRPTYGFDVSCQGSVPESIIAFLESTDFEDAIRNAVSIGGDTDTVACITGGIAEAFYKEIPSHIMVPVLELIPDDLRPIVDTFIAEFR